MPLNRFFVKSFRTYLVYDRVTGQLVGDTINEKVKDRILRPRGLHYDERIDPATAKIALGQEENFHLLFVDLMYKTKLDKEFEKAAIKS